VREFLAKEKKRSGLGLGTIAARRVSPDVFGARVLFFWVSWSRVVMRLSERHGGSLAYEHGTGRRCYPLPCGTDFRINLVSAGYRLVEFTTLSIISLFLSTVRTSGSTTLTWFFSRCVRMIA